MSENIVMVTVDSFRADHCGYMGYEKDITPTIDEMGTEGTFFENAVSPGPRTPESMPVIFTGQFLPDDLPTDMVPQQSIIRQHMGTRYSLPQRLSEMGYETIGITPNPFTSRYFGFDEGFDHYVDFIGEEDNSLYERLFEGWLGGNTVSNVMRLARNMVMQEEVFKPWEALYDDVLESVEQASEPYFVWVFLMDVHEPYIAGDGYHSLSMRERWSAIWRLYLGDKETPFSEKTVDRLTTAYEDSIRYTDAFFEQLREDLGDGEDGPTIIMHGDHGEAFGEHGVFSHEPYLYDENIHVPLVVSEDLDVDPTKPLSLRRLPDLVTGIASGDDGNVEERPYAVARTTKDDKIALRSPEWKYLESATDWSLYDVSSGGEESYDDEGLCEVAGAAAAGYREQDRELDRVCEAADRVVSDGKV